MKNKKVPPVKEEPKFDDLLEILGYLDPNDIKNLYFVVIGILTTRGYKFVD